MGDLLSVRAELVEAFVFSSEEGWGFDRLSPNGFGLPSLVSTLFELRSCDRLSPNGFWFPVLKPVPRSARGVGR
jgi:hypothetical protein